MDKLVDFKYDDDGYDHGALYFLRQNMLILIDRCWKISRERRIWIFVQGCNFVDVIDIVEEKKKKEDTDII